MSELKDILAISGHGGLFRYISQGRSGIIVESLVDKKRTNMPATSKISSLDDIAIYTEEEDMPLVEVMRKIRDKYESKPVLSAKASSKELKTFFEEILPTYDKDRVYVSDIKKVVKWYNLLVELDMLELIDKSDDDSEEVLEGDNTNQSDEKTENKTEN